MSVAGLVHRIGPNRRTRRRYLYPGAAAAGGVVGYRRRKQIAGFARGAAGSARGLRVRNAVSGFLRGRSMTLGKYAAGRMRAARIGIIRPSGLLERGAAKAAGWLGRAARFVK